MGKIKILNVYIDNLGTKELIKKLSRYGGIVFTPNVDHVMKLQKDCDFHQAYQAATYKTCDSKILLYASYFLQSPVREKVSGSDFFPAFYQYHKNNNDIKIFLLGAAEGVAEKAQNIINQKVGREIIIATYSPPFGFEKDEQECHKIINLVNNSQANVLGIGVGAPKQEKWIYKHKDRLNKIKIILAIGATIDFEAGEKQRSPKWMSNLGVEWLHRLLTEPRRLWRRYLLEGVPFFWLILNQKFNLYKEPFQKHNLTRIRRN